MRAKHDPSAAPAALLAAALLLLMAGGGCARKGPTADQQPNVLLISIDTLRADKLGAYGHSPATSPTIDARLAAEGATFTRALSQSPKTTPAHMTLLSSLYPCVHGVDMWDEQGRGRALRPEIDTLAEVLKRSGYATVAFTGNGHVHASRGFDQGFDVYEHGKPLDKSLAWLRAHGKEQSFFLFYHTYAVHDPYVHPLKYVRQFDKEYDGPFLDVLEKLNDKRSNWNDRARIFWDGVDQNDLATVAFIKHLYEAGILRMDEVQVTQLLGALEELGLARDTLVVFTSDHGEAFLEHGHFLHEDLHVESLHVPLIVRFPGRVRAGARFDAPVTLLDVMPTILDLVGIPAQTAAQGRSLAPLIKGGTLEPRPVISEWDGAVAVRDGGFSYIVGRADEAIYDLSRDPGEQTSAVAWSGAALEARRAQKATWESECRTRVAALGPPPEGDAPTAETEKQLRALGYVK